MPSARSCISRCEAMTIVKGASSGPRWAIREGGIGRSLLINHRQRRRTAIRSGELARRTAAARKLRKMAVCRRASRTVFQSDYNKSGWAEEEGRRRRGRERKRGRGEEGKREQKTDAEMEGCGHG